MSTRPADALAAGPRPLAARPLRALWLGAGMVWLLLGTVGIVVPLLPTVDCYALGAFCFARGSRRWEAWLLAHRHIGPLVRDWRANRSLPLGAKCLATLSMSASCAWAVHAAPPHVAWPLVAVCLLVAAYLWSRPTRRSGPPTAVNAPTAGMNRDAQA